MSETREELDELIEQLHLLHETLRRDKSPILRAIQAIQHLREDLDLAHIDQDEVKGLRAQLAAAEREREELRRAVVEAFLAGPSTLLTVIDRLRAEPTNQGA